MPRRVSKRIEHVSETALLPNSGKLTLPTFRDASRQTDLTATAATATKVDDYGDDSGHLDSGNCDDDGGEANAKATAAEAVMTTAALEPAGGLLTTDENEDDPVMCSRKNAFNELGRAYFASLHHDVCEQHQAYVNWKNKTNLRYDG